MQRVMSNGLKFVVLIVVTNSVFGKPRLLAKPVDPLERYKRQAEVSPPCFLECAQQGSECQIEKGITKCVCRSCVIPIKNMFTCASNNRVYFSPCYMDRAACLNNISLLEMDCLPSSSTERPDNDLTTSGASTEIDRLTTQMNHVTYYYQKCIENYIVQLRNCNENELPAIGFVHKNGKCRREAHGFCPATHNYYKSRKECLDTCENPCTKPISDEVCSKDYKMRFKFVVESKQCESFDYWGCGNAGFRTAERCKDACNRNNTLPNNCSPTCSQYADELTMKTNDVIYYQKCNEDYRVQLKNCSKYDAHRRTRGFVHKNGKCKRKKHKFCSTMHNYYISRKECLNTCQNPCTKPISDEICSTNVTARLRFKFDVESKQCKVFIHLGCGKPGFKTDRRCKDACISNITLPNNCSSTCTQNAGSLFCTQDFVVAGKLKLITNFTQENPRRQLFVKLTRVFKDNHQLRLFSRIENVSSEATLYMNVNTDRECPCPNIARKLALNESYPDNEFVISGMVVDGMATLNQGSFVKLATREIVRHMNVSNVKDSPETVYGKFCNLLRRIHEKELSPIMNLETTTLHA